MVIEDVDGEENISPTEEPNKGSNLVNDSKGSDSKSVSKGNNSKKSGRKIKIEEVNEEETVVNGHVETREFNQKTKQEILVNGEVNHAGGDTDKSKDIWTEEDVDKQSPVKSSEKGDSVVRNTIDRGSKSEGAISQSSNHNSDNDRTKGPVEKDVEGVKIGALTEEVVEQEQTNKEAEENETVQSAEEDKDTENSENSDDSGEDTDVAKTPLKRPVFHQKPFPVNCVKLREEGNTLFKNGQYGDAISRYSKVIGTLENGRSFISVLFLQALEL